MEEELETGIRREIGVTAGNRVDSRRFRYDNCRRQRKPYPDMKIYVT
jgi:hypothetical protein